MYRQPGTADAPAGSTTPGIDGVFAAVAGDMAGDVLAGDVVAGDVVAGDVVAGDAGDVVAGDAVAGLPGTPLAAAYNKHCHLEIIRQQCYIAL